ncbi:double-strand break repair helicase AddA [Sulfitobacter sabulilitoris]|uniref:DNA 3'-5' helicase n=1 Tax=Sulfitobacter sabulilitoris TaxID=2562655 RepID=A0A5S3PEY5_9RHOB|nr:double-strand break repair helicase AddA [Sulfitobacter sabulilitoris]TMM52588.1 double-strand break repair helicase AddA [Sulfitobacter sabulilitoris]
MIQRDAATQRQVDAARPDVSTWLAANAGSGKTRVLTDRVARLLLDGVEPQHILCLTYTKAAASEMQNRLFRRLGEWAMLGQDALRDALVQLGAEGQLDDANLRAARTLFARAIETPGGLKIQTIHSFCASLLRRFPLEAGVSPQFTEIEDRAADLLREEIVDRMADGADSGVVAGIATHFTGEELGKLTRAIVGQREAFANPVDWAACLALFGQPTDLSAERIERGVFQGGEAEMIARIVPPMLTKGGNDGKAAEKLRTLRTIDYAALPVLEGVFLNGAKAKAPFAAKIGGFPTKPTQKVIADDLPLLNDLMQRVEEARQPRLALLAARKTYALHRFAARFVPLYEHEKLIRGWLDFDDLILKARQLLTDPRVAAWVLFRIDGGIDHILVDEAQDTSPAQWDVIRKLAAEFSSGEGARSNVARTLFVVGDKKQSIYSFQGADPREFDRMQAEFDTKLTAAGHVFQDSTLDHSFRSSSAILRLVDATFDNRIQAGFAKDALHVAFKADLPGRVDLWPVVDKQDDDDDRLWSDPVDRRSARHHTVLLANQIACNIKRMIDTGQTVPVDGPTPGSFVRRPVRAGDVLILVQRRSELFAEIIRACKAHQLPIAGADRLKVGAELAVKDLGALLSFLATPEDSLSLATALKSPLFGWTEQALFDLAHRRTQPHLWQALRQRGADFPDTITILRDLRANTDFLRPYDLIERILTRHGGRARLLSRLGPEAEDGINALLSQALAYERSAVPSLTGFLVWMETDDLDIKRQIDSASDQIRVMTVHGAKGLEAPIVILPDTGKRDIQIKDEIVSLNGTPVWKANADDMPDTMRDAIDKMKDAQHDERLRLLYVALTRAEKWLIVAAAGDLSNDGSSWYQMVQAALLQSGATEQMFDGSPGLRLQEGDWDDLEMASVSVPPRHDATLPELFSRAAPAPADRSKTVSPSDLGGAKALPGDQGEDEDTAKRYGSLVHFYLEHLGGRDPADWPTILAALHPAGAADDTARRAAEEAMSVASAPALADLFAPGTMAEVPISAAWGESRLHGIVDRLIVTDTRVLAVDFKTNRTVPGSAAQCPEGLLRQMGAYAHALAQIYPGKRIETSILWTRDATLMPLSHDLVNAALRMTPDLDEAGRGS